MTILLLIRHATNDFVGKRLAGRLPGVHLNAEGLRQAEALALQLVRLPIQAIYASPMERTQETAAPLAQALELSVHPHNGLLEVDYGAWQGRTAKDLHRLRLWKTVMQAPEEMRFPGGESFHEARSRVAAALEEISSLHAEKDMVACFSHCDTIRLALTHFLGLPIGAFHQLTVDPASFSAVFHHSGATRLLYLNREAPMQ